jgi:hypothetical protein
MAFDAKTQRLISLKKLSGKAHTSNDKDLANEGNPTGLTVSVDTIFGQSIPAHTGSVSEYVILSNSAGDGVAEFLRLSASFVAGTDTSAGRHGFSLKLPDDYESKSKNPLAGTDPFLNSRVIYVTTGALQLIPPSYDSDYEGKPYHTGSGETAIPVLDARDWYLDYFNGVFFQQDPPGTGDDSSNPRYMDGYLYVGSYLNKGKFNTGISGSLTRLTDGTSYLQAGSNITITSGSSGQIIIASSGGGSALAGIDDQTSSNDDQLTITDSAVIINEDSDDLDFRVESNSNTHMLFVDGGTNKVGINADSPGQTFSVTGSIGASLGISGSLTKLLDGKSYLQSGDGISIVSSSNGQIIITNDGTVGDITAVTAGTGLTGGGSSGAVTLTIDDSIAATVSGTTFSGAVAFSAGLSGSLTRLTSGKSFLQGGSNITIVSESNGQIVISAAALNGVNRSRTAYTVTSSHSAGASLALTGADFSDGGLSPGYIDVYVNGMLMQSGTTAQMTAGTSDYTLAGNTTVKFAFQLERDDVVDTAIITSGSGETFAVSDAPYLTFEASSDLSAERVLSAGAGLSLSTSDAGSAELSINRNKVSYVVTASHPSDTALTISGATFNSGSHSDDRIDVFLNGQMMTSGSSSDYELSGNPTDLSFKFTLEGDDTVTVIIQ